MKNLKTVGLLFCITIAASALSATASESDKLTVFTFGAPVEVPGNIVLPPGTYVFKLLDGSADRNVVQIFDEQQTTIYATILTISVERLEPTYTTVIEFYETDGSPQNALEAWFYPGDLSGQEFVYPKGRAAELAKAERQRITLISSTFTRSPEQR